MNRARLAKRIFRNAMQRYSRPRLIVRRDPEELKRLETERREWTRSQIEKYGAGL